MDFSPCESAPLSSPQDQLMEQISSCLLSGMNWSISTRSSCNEWSSLASKLFPSTTASARSDSSYHFSSTSLSPFQMLDMIRPLNKHAITLKDLKQCKMTPVFFDTFFNLEKYLDHEQRDPFATQRETDEDGNEVIKTFYETHWYRYEMSDWFSPFSDVRMKLIFFFSDVRLGPICSRGIRASCRRRGNSRTDGWHVSWDKKTKKRQSKLWSMQVLKDPSNQLGLQVLWRGGRSWQRRSRRRSWWPEQLGQWDDHPWQLRQCNQGTCDSWSKTKPCHIQDKICESQTTQTVSCTIRGDEGRGVFIQWEIQPTQSLKVNPNVGA